MSDPEPTIVFTVPATTPAAITRAAANGSLITRRSVRLASRTIW